MNCKEFTSIVRDYSRLEWLSGAVREEAAKHVAGCAPCWERLTLELAYESRRAALARKRREVEAPPRVELDVMAAYRRRTKVAPDPLRWFLRPWFLGTSLVTMIVGATWMLPIPQPKGIPQESSSGEFAASSPAEYGQMTSHGHSQPGRMASLEPQSGQAQPEKQPAEPLREVSGAAVTAGDNAVHALSAHRRTLAAKAPRAVLAAAGGVAKAGVAVRSVAEGGMERVTEFVPLRYGKPVEPGELLRVVRIPLDGRELMRMGIPVPPDSGVITVKADVIVGEDGMAKAIRFVY
jgi:hypothetical protein